MESINMWHENRVTVKPNRVVMKKVDKSGSFHKSVIIPTDLYPLHGAAEVFSYLNTKMLPKEYRAAVDSVKYKIGHCYTNAERVTAALVKAGANAVSYGGWLFTGAAEFPIHHHWTVVDGNIVVDLADDHWLLYSGENIEAVVSGDLPKEEVREYLASFHQQVKDLPNSARCAPIGIPAPTLYYVGSPCEPEQGRRIYQNLISRYPAHECQRNVDKDGWNATQKLFREKGLM